MEARARLRDLGISIGLLPTGAYNAITDVPGVRVGHTTLFSGSGPLVVGKGPVRTGVTVVLPHSGNYFEQRVPAAVHVLNGAGEMSGRTLVEEWGVLTSPIYLTNTYSVGLVYDAAIQFALKQSPHLPEEGKWVIPLVAECADTRLNDSAGHHVRAEHVFAAIESAQSGRVEEGCVGAGTGMIAYGYKSGIGTSSRLVEIGSGFAVGALVLANHGQRQHLSVRGVPIGMLSKVPEPAVPAETPTSGFDGSIIIVLATDAPLLPSQLRRLAVRATLGLARTGSTSGHGSGDLVIAFSTGNTIPLAASSPIVEWRSVHDSHIPLLFNAAVEATEEAVLNALTAAQTVEGRDGFVAHALSLEELKAYCSDSRWQQELPARP